MELLSKKEADSMRLYEREITLKRRGCKPVTPKYVIVFEDPDDLDAPCKIQVPTPEWIAYCLHGNFICSAEHFIRDKRFYAEWTKNNPNQQFNWKDHGGNSASYAETLPAMTQEEAMELLLQKDVPERVWNNTTSNATRYKICRKEMIPSNRQYRNAWRLAA